MRKTADKDTDTKKVKKTTTKAEAKPAKAATKATKTTAKKASAKTAKKDAEDVKETKKKTATKVIKTTSKAKTTKTTAKKSAKTTTKTAAKTTKSAKSTKSTKTTKLNPKWDDVIEGTPIVYKTKRWDDDANYTYLELLKQAGCEVEYDYVDDKEELYKRVFVTNKGNQKTFSAVFSTTREAYNDLKKWKYIK